MKQKPHPRSTATDAEIDAAIARSKEWELYRPVAGSARYHAANDTLTIAFKSGAELTLPRKVLQGG